MNRYLIVLMVIGLTAGSIVTAEAANKRTKPTQIEPGALEPKKAAVRSGSILSGTGWFLDVQMGGCQVSPECAAWLETDCNDALAGWDPGATASIVDVDELADGHTKRVFQYGSGDPLGPAYGGVQLQFWNSNCVEVSDMRWRSTDCDGDASGRDCKSKRFRIPTSVRWMTVTGYQDNVNLAWTLT